MTARRRQRVTTVATAAFALLLAGCSPTQTILGLRPNTTVMGSEPVLTSAQAETIATRALGQAQLADTQQTDAAAALAFTGMALRTAGPAYLAQRALTGTPKASGQGLTDVPPATRIVVMAGATFPRSLVAVWTPKGGQSPQLAIMTSGSVSEPYRVSARTNLLPPSVLPDTAPASVGAARLAPDVPGLIATPKQALADLATWLETGKEGKTNFKASQVVTDVRANAVAQAKGVTSVATFSQRHDQIGDPLLVIRTANGGALVISALTRVDTFSVRPGAGSITPPAVYRALAKGLDKITKSAAVTTIEVVAVVLPIAGKGEAQLIGFNEIPVAIKAS